MFQKISIYAILERGEKETLYQRKDEQVATEKRAAAWPGFQYLWKMGEILFFC